MLGRFPFEEGEFAMKRFLLLALGNVLGASVAFGQAGYIALYSDLARTSCYLSVTDAGGTKRVYIYHMMAAGTTARWCRRRARR
jgi:hypothetical protein